MDDIREQMDLANEISEAISQPVGFGELFDEEELNRELEELENEGLQEELEERRVELPSVPRGVPGEQNERSESYASLVRVHVEKTGSNRDLLILSLIHRTFSPVTILFHHTNPSFSWFPPTSSPNLCDTLAHPPVHHALPGTLARNSNRTTTTTCQTLVKRRRRRCGVGGVEG